MALLIHSWIYWAEVRLSVTSFFEFFLFYLFKGNLPKTGCITEELANNFLNVPRKINFSSGSGNLLAY